MNRNCKIVKVKQDRVCFHCKNKIKQGDFCLTINKRYKGRKWMCLSCYESYKDMLNAKQSLDSVAFDDEGGAWACIDYLAECEADFYSKEK